MKTITASLFISLILTINSSAQDVSGRVKFDQGQKLEVTMQIKSTIAQQAMGQTIDFKADADAVHFYKVTNATADNTTLGHQVQSITFGFDGWGQKLKFDSGVEKDMKGPFGKPVKEMLEKKYDIIIDSTGNTMLAIPEKIKLAEADSRMALISGMIKDVLDLVQPPQKGKASFFKLLPSGTTAKGSSWFESGNTETGKFETTYTLTDVTDSLILIDFVSASTTVTKAEMMGNVTTTTMNNKSTGKIIADKATGLIKEKTISTDSNGNTESTFGTLPVTSKTTTIITVKPVPVL